MEREKCRRMDQIRALELVFNHLLYLVKCPLGLGTEEWARWRECFETTVNGSHFQVVEIFSGHHSFILIQLAFIADLIHVGVYKGESYRILALQDI